VGSSASSSSALSIPLGYAEPDRCEPAGATDEWRAEARSDGAGACEGGACEVLVVAAGTTGAPRLDGAPRWLDPTDAELSRCDSAAPLRERAESPTKLERPTSLSTSPPSRSSSVASISAGTGTAASSAIAAPPDGLVSRTRLEPASSSA
jgi:hypothetical protein